MDNKIQIRKNGTQLGAFALKPFDIGDTILILTGSITSQPSKYSIQLSLDQHLEVPEGIHAHDAYSWRFLNHNCIPNAHVDVLNKNLIAIKPIAAGEEICFNYNSTEHTLAAPFECHCNNKIRPVKGYKFTSPEEKEFLRPLLAPYLSSLNLL